MTASRDRKQAAKVLGITMQAQLRALIEADSPDAIQLAAIQLGDTFNRNSEFIVWVLKEYGGVKQMPFGRPAKPKPANDLPLASAPQEALPTIPAFLTGEQQLPAELEKCTCDVLEAGIIGRDKHMASCPQFEPA